MLTSVQLYANIKNLFDKHPQVGPSRASRRRGEPAAAPSSRQAAHAAAIAAIRK